MSNGTKQTAQLRPFEKVAALAGGAVVFTIVAYGTRRLLGRLFGPDEPERVVIVVREGQDVEVLPSDYTVVVEQDEVDASDEENAS